MKTPTAGDRVGRYRLVSLLGRGGMGEVHLADDESLGRKVAIKFLSETLRGDERARRRFAREARSAAALDHPYICKVYDEGEHRGVPYIAMEYVEGTTLRERIDQQGLPVAEALRIAVDITDALAYAHDRGIVHRDLKPSNIFLTPHGHVKILDFGLARRLPEFVGIAPGQEQPSTSDLTTEGCAAGTVPYMAPEQLRGQPATALSDIFSIGVLLYEMLTGIHPFRRETSFETAHAILHDTPAPPAAPSPDIPAEVWQCLERVLDKAPRNRPSSCHDLRAELRSLLHSSESTAVSIRVQPRGAGHRRFRFAALALAVALAAIGFAAVIRTVRKDTGPAPVAAEPAAVETSIAVLPLTNLSADPDFEYFCDGMTDEIISGLTRISGLRVTARTSAFAFRDSHQDAREIGRQLRVAYLVSGSVRRAGHRLRVAVTLVDTASGFNLWSQEYEERLTDVLDVQNRISRAIVGALPVKEPSSDANLWSPPPTMDGDAYVLYLKGLHLLNQRTGPALQASIRLFGQAVDRDPRFALAYVGIADAYSLSEYYARLTPSEAARRSGAAIERALAIDPNLAEARAARAALLEKRWDWSGALGEYEHALRAKPGDARTRCWYAALLAQLGRNAEAERETERSVQLDPLSPYAHVVSGLVAYLGRRNDEALAHADLALHIAPDYHLAHELRAYALVQAGQPERAVDAARSAREAGGPGRAEVAEAVACAAAGRRDEALAILRTLEAEWREGHGSPGRLAVICAGLGAVDEALEWLARARDEKDIWIAQLKADPVFDVLRGDPRFRRLLREVGLEVGA